MEKIKIETEEQLFSVAQEGFYILRNFTEAVERWRKEYGSVNKEKIDFWQNKAKEFLKNPTSIPKYTKASLLENNIQRPPELETGEVDPEDKYIEERIFGKD